MHTGMWTGVDRVSRAQRLVKSHATRRSVTSAASMTSMTSVASGPSASV
jgi:hypothetical protein